MNECSQRFFVTIFWKKILLLVLNDYRRKFAWIRFVFLQIVNEKQEFVKTLKSLSVLAEQMGRQLPFSEFVLNSYEQSSEIQLEIE